MLALEDAVWRETPARFRTEEDTCRFVNRRVIDAIAANAPGRGAELFAQAPAYCARDNDLRFNVYAANVQAGRYPEAAAMLPSLDGNGRLEPRFVPLRDFLACQTLMALGDPVGAERRFVAARTAGMSECRLLVCGAQAAAAQGHFPQAAVRLERTYACDLANGHDVPATLRLAMRFWAQAGRTDRVEVLSRQLPPGP
jgi:hypothetical protein